MSDKQYSIPEGAKPVNSSPDTEIGEMFAAEKARIAADLAADTISIQDLILDGSNEVAFPGSAYTMRAVNEKITVCMDL